MWQAKSNLVAGGRGWRVSLSDDSRALTFHDALQAWRDDAKFREFFNRCLVEAPFTAFRWETPAVTTATASQPFEFVLLESPGLVRAPEPEAFADYFSNARDGVAVFSNLGGDAILVVPTPESDELAYGHLAAFVREARAKQQHALWQAVAQAMFERLCSEPVWLSTAGAGVSWLHVRLDDRPKYYGFEPYRSG